MKKISKLVLSTVVILALCLTMFSFNALAAGSASIAFSNQSPTVADTVTVKVTVSAPNMYGINITGTYNEEVLSYVSGASSAGAGIFQIAETESFNGESSKSFSIVFKAKKAGSSPITFSGQVSCQETVGTLPVDVDVSTSATLTVKDVTLSNNANLKYLRPGAGSFTAADEKRLYPPRADPRADRQIHRTDGKNRLLGSGAEALQGKIAEPG